MRSKTSFALDIMERLEAVNGIAEISHQFDPMEELVSCILSQHTSDANSFPAFDKLREHYDDWQAVVDGGEGELAKVVRSAGLANQKSKSIIKCLKKIKERTGRYSIDFLREMPLAEARKWLTDLPGIGPKTASIVLCFRFGMDAIPVDTHVYRVAWRIGFIKEGIGETKAHDALEKIVPKGHAFRFHTDLIEHGRSICKAPLPRCEHCFVSEFCRWYKKGGPEKRREELMRARKKRA